MQRFQNRNKCCESFCYVRRVVIILFLNKFLLRSLSISLIIGIVYTNKENSFSQKSIITKACYRNCRLDLYTCILNVHWTQKCFVSKVGTNSTKYFQNLCNFLYFLFTMLKFMVLYTVICLQQNLFVLNLISTSKKLLQCINYIVVQPERPQQ